jgi:hypothetical protein
MAEKPLTDAELVELRAHLADSDESNGDYPAINGITWHATYTSTEVKQANLRWAVGGVVLSLAFLGFAALVLSRATGAAAVVGITGAVVGGLLLVCAGIGQMHGEVLHAEDASAPLPPGSLGLAVRGLDPVAVVHALKEGIGGLTAARSMVFAGAALLAVAALGAGVSALGGSGTTPGATPSPSVSASAEATG